jgi:TonB family protein
MSFEGIASENDATRGIAWYQPQFAFWQIDHFKLFPTLESAGDGTRSMLLTVVVKDPPPGRPTAMQLDDGNEVWIIPIGPGDSIDTHDSGCRVTQTIRLQNQAGAVEKLATATSVEVTLTGYSRRLHYKVPSIDLAAIRRIAQLWEAPSLPAAETPPEEPAASPEAAMAEVTNPELIKPSKRAPAFPKFARGKRAYGRVKLQALIRKDGTVGDITVVQGAGGDCGFEAAAVEAVSHWRYKPGMQEGKPVDVHFTVVIEFRYGP